MPAAPKTITTCWVRWAVQCCSVLGTAAQTCRQSNSSSDLQAGRSQRSALHGWPFFKRLHDSPAPARLAACRAVLRAALPVHPCRCLLLDGPEPDRLPRQVAMDGVAPICWLRAMRRHVAAAVPQGAVPPALSLFILGASVTARSRLVRSVPRVAVPVPAAAHMTYRNHESQAKEGDLYYYGECRSCGLVRLVAAPSWWCSLCICTAQGLPCSCAMLPAACMCSNTAQAAEPVLLAVT